MQQPPKILLRGVIPNPWTPSDSLFNVEVTLTNIFDDSRKYMNWKEILEDKLNELDKKYTLRAKGLRGRRVEAEYKTMKLATGEKTRVRVLTLQPYPSRFMSALGYIRTKFYGSPNTLGVLEEHSIILSEDKRGKLTVQTRLVPEAMLPLLRSDIAELNKQLDVLQVDIDRYESETDFLNLKNYILEDVPPHRWSKQPDKLHTQLHPIQLNPWPLVASKDFIDSFTDEETKKEVRASISKVVLQTVQATQKDMNSFIERLTKALIENTLSNEDLRYVESGMSKMQRMSIETGTYHFVRPNIEAIQALIAAINTKDAEALVKASKLAADHFNVRRGKTPVDTLKAISDNLTGNIDPRIKSVVNQILGEK